MGKLSIGVVSTEVYRTNLHPGPFHVFVRLRVDGKYIFTTKKRNDRRATFLETFVVGNTHRLALVEASVYHRSDRGEELLLGSCVVSIKRLSRGVEKVREHLLVGVSRSASDEGSAETTAREKMIAETLMLPSASAPAGITDEDLINFSNWANNSVTSLCATTPWGASEANRRVSAFIDPARITSPQATITQLNNGPAPTTTTKTSAAWNVGGDGNGAAVPHLHADRNDDLIVTGKIVLSLFSDDLGDYGLSLNTKVEEAYTQRLRRLCYLYHRAVLDRVDLLIADVRENYELPGGGGISSSGSTSNQDQHPPQQNISKASSPTTGGRNVTIRVPDTHTHPDQPQLPCFGRSFADVLERVTTELGPEKQPHTLTVRVEGANNLSHDAIPSHSSQMNPFVVIRSDWEQFETSELLATSNPDYSPDASTFQLEVLDPSTFRLEACVMTRISSRGTEGELPIGYSAMTLQCLPTGIVFPRVLPLVRDSVMAGILRLGLTAHHFGRSAEMVDETSHRLRQLTRFLIRYEPAALPFVDAAVQRHELVWAAFMSGLVQKYGREPGTVQLGLCVNSICSLVPPPLPPPSLDDTANLTHTGKRRQQQQQWPISVYVSIRMGDTSLRTSTKKYFGFEEVIINDTFVLDVARETDEIHIEVIEDKTEFVIGRVDLTILGIQRGVTHARNYTVVSAAGTPSAACAGRLSFSMHCDQIGVDYEVDHESECMFAMRLTRFCERYIPEKLHRVDIAVATTEDMETFLGQLAFDHGPEPSYVRVSVTVEGLKHLGQRYTNYYTHVILECGVLERHETRIAKMGTQDPEFHETWVMDQPRRDLTLRLKVVASQASNMSERILIATAAIPIIMDHTSDTRWVPLSYMHPDDATSYKGSIGVGTFVQPLTLSNVGGVSDMNRSTTLGASIKSGGGSNLVKRLHGGGAPPPELVASNNNNLGDSGDLFQLHMSPLRPMIATNVSFDTSPLRRATLQGGGSYPSSPGVVLGGTVGQQSTTSPFNRSSASDWQLTTVFVEVHSVRGLPPFRPSGAAPPPAASKHRQGERGATSILAPDNSARIYFVARIIHVSAPFAAASHADPNDGGMIDASNVDDDDVLFESSRVPLGDVDANACVWNTDSPSHFRCRVDLPTASSQKQHQQHHKRGGAGEGAYYRATFPVLCLTFYCIPPSSASHHSIPSTVTSCAPTPSSSPIKHVMFSSDPQPRPKKIGDCFISLANLPTLPQQWNKHLPMVNASGRAFARTLGVVHAAVSSTATPLSDLQQQLRLSSFGAPASNAIGSNESLAAGNGSGSGGDGGHVVRPTEASEEKIRRDLSRFLQAKAPDQLHLVDVLFSEFLGREDEMWQRLSLMLGGGDGGHGGRSVPLYPAMGALASPRPMMVLSDVSTPSEYNNQASALAGVDAHTTSAAGGGVQPLVAHITLKHIQNLVASDGRGSPLFEAANIMLKIKTPREKIKTKPFAVSQNQFFLDEMIVVHLVDPAAAPTAAVLSSSATAAPSEDPLLATQLLSVSDAADVPILDDDPNEIHVEVYSCSTFGSKTLICETYLSLGNTQRGVPRERSHILMTPTSEGKKGKPSHTGASSTFESAGGAAFDPSMAVPIACGLLTVVISNDGGSRGLVASDQQERDVQLRFRSFFECYCPSQLCRLDLYVGAALQRNQTHMIMSRLKEAYGPEPGDNRLEVTVNRCRGTLQTDKNGGHSRPFVVLALGMAQFRTRSQYALTDDIAFQRETFTFHVGLPDQQELHVYLMDEGTPLISLGGGGNTQSPASSKKRSPLSGAAGSHERLLEGTESGRVLVSLAHMGKRGVACKRTLPLVFRAGTKDAVTYGSIEVTLLSNSFGSHDQPAPHDHNGSPPPPHHARRTSTGIYDGDLPQSPEAAFTAYQERVLRLLSRYAPEALHRYDIIMGKYVHREEDMIRDLVGELGAEPGTYPLYVRIIGFRGPNHFSRHQKSFGGQPTAAQGANRLVLSDMQQRTEDDHNVHDGDALVFKVFNNGEEVLKTDTCKVDHGVANLSSAQHNDVRTELRDIQGSVLSFELYRRGFFGKKTFLSACDVGVRHLVRDFSNVRWLALFRVEGASSTAEGAATTSDQLPQRQLASASSHHHQQSSFIGILGVEMKTCAFGLPSAKRDEEQMSDIGVDVLTLLRKYNPAGLRQLDVFLERTPSMSGAHALLRKAFNPSAVSTLYVAIHSIQLDLKPAPRGGARGMSIGGGLGLTPDAPKKPSKSSLHHGGSNANLLSEPAVWKSGETSKRVVCMGLLAGEMMRCEGVCTRNATAGVENSNISSFGALRFDVVPTPGSTSADAGGYPGGRGASSSTTANTSSTSTPTLSLQVVETSKNGNITLGAVEISARAILAQPRALLFGTDEGPLTFPMVLVQQSTSAVDAYISGSITLSVSRPAYEPLPAFLSYSADSWKHIELAAGEKEDIIVSYYRRILRMLQFYDPAALVTFHRSFFDQEVNSGAACKWRLPRMLETLKEQWGPEPRE